MFSSSKLFSSGLGGQLNDSTIFLIRRLSRRSLPRGRKLFKMYLGFVRLVLFFRMCYLQCINRTNRMLVYSEFTFYR